MNISDIISDSLVYPINNIKALIVYAIIGIIGGVLGGASLFAMISGTLNGQAAPVLGFGIIGFIILLITELLIQGYTLDIIKFGIERRNDAPGIDFVRQIANAIKLVIIGIVYYLIPFIAYWLLTTLLGTGIITLLIAFIIIVLFSLGLFMAKCRLAQTDDLAAGLAIGDAISDVFRVGIIRILALVIIVAIILLIIGTILGMIYSFNNTLGGILYGILIVYAVFFYNRAVGLLYSDA